MPPPVAPWTRPALRWSSPVRTLKFDHWFIGSSGHLLRSLPSRAAGSAVITYRDLKTLDEYAAVVDLEREIWGPGYDDPVPVPILAVTVLRGGILIGGFDGDRLIGFVYSLPGIKGGKPTQWSHMLGVVDEFRNDGIGYRLKLMQRERTIAMGVELVEW